MKTPSFDFFFFEGKSDYMRPGIVCVSVRERENMVCK